MTINLKEAESPVINLTGTCDEIPYNDKNLVYKAVELYLASHEHAESYEISVHIEKNIPVSAGLAGGSTDAAGVLFGLNKLLNYYSHEQLHELCARLGSDLNFCLEGGCMLAEGRGEILTPLDFVKFDLSLIKPKYIGISAKEAYTKYSELENKPQTNVTDKLINGSDISECLHNDLEIALLNEYEELKFIKENYKGSMMTGSGSAFFILEPDIENKPDAEIYWIKTGLSSVSSGVDIVYPD